MDFESLKGKGSFGKYTDVESGPSADMLYPGIGMTDNALRWGFIRKVYGIVSVQLVLTTIIAAVFSLNPSAQGFVLSAGGGWVFIVTLILPFIALIPLFIYRFKHPLNLVLLGIWTAALSVTVGLSCSLYKASVILEALALTSAVVVGLTAYSFYAVRQGKDFSAWGPMLYTSLWVLIVWGFIQFFFNPGPVGEFVFSLVGALVFCLYIIYDTDNLIKRYSYDEYVWASVGLYLDVINLFIRLLQILGYLNNNN